MKKTTLVFCVLLSCVAFGYSQNARRTVTNFELEKYRNQRSAAEREYRETYAQRGMLSPDELKSASEIRMQQTLDLAQQLRAQEIEERRLALEARAQEIQLEDIRSRQQMLDYYPYDNSVWGVGIIGSDFGRFGGWRFSRFRGQGHYAAGGNVWSAPLGSTPTIRRPSFQISAPRGRH
jgi:hypothetical protein